MGELICQKLQPIGERVAREHLIPLPAAFGRPAVEHDAAAASLVAQVVPGRADHQYIYWRARRADRVEHLLIMPIAQLRSFLGDRHDDRPRRLALLEALRDFDDGV